MSDAQHLLIVGAGPTGLTAAVELARRGSVPVVVDSGDGPTPLSKAVGISSRSLDILEPSGIAARLLDQGIRLRRLVLHRHARSHGHGARLATIEFGGLHHRFPFLLALPQSDTESVMADALTELGGSVRWRTRLSALRVQPNGVDVVLDGPAGREEASFDLVYGADGARSAVRHCLGVDFPGYEHERSWSIADTRIGDWPYAPDAAHLFLHDGGDLGFIVPIAESRFRAVSNTVDAMARIPGGYRVVERLRQDVFDIPVRQADRYQAGGVFLGGDAAHVHSPVGARGMNLGIEDAACFARRFEERSLAGYESERRPVGGRWIRLSERILAGAQATGPVARRARDAAIRMIGRSRRLQRPMLERVAGLKE